MKTLSKTSVVIAVLAVVGACNASDSQYRDLAASTNATLKKLSDIVAPLYAEDASAPAAGTRVVAACLAAEPELGKLRNLDFHDRAAARKAGTSEAKTIVDTLLEHRPTMCMPETGDGSRTVTCQAWCIERWRSLAAAVELVRTAAKHDGVEIASLRPGK